MKVYTLYSLVFVLLLSSALNAQVNSNTSTQNNQAKNSSPNNATQKNTSKPATMSQATDSIKFAVNDFKKSMNSIFGNKKDTIQIFISDIEYDNANLSLLKESLKKIKGGKFVNMQYKSSNAVLEVSFKGSSTDLRDQIPADSKKSFKIVEANDRDMTLAIRN